MTAESAGWVRRASDGEGRVEVLGLVAVALAR